MPNTVLEIPSKAETTKPAMTVDDLLKKKRLAHKNVAPSDGFWNNHIAPNFARKMMAALSRPRKHGKALMVFGWVTPFAFVVALVIAVAIAYFFSPDRAIARWEKQAGQKQYVVDPISNETGKSYALDGAKNEMKTTGVKIKEESNSYHFIAAASKDSEF
jgi:hypothetical protein